MTKQEFVLWIKVETALHYNRHLNEGVEAIHAKLSDAAFQFHLYNDQDRLNRMVKLAKLFVSYCTLECLDPVQIRAIQQLSLVLSGDADEDIQDIPYID